MSEAEKSLSKAVHAVIPELGIDLFIKRSDVLAAMKEIASLAFAAGMDSTMKNTTLVHKAYQTGKKTDIAAIQKDKEQFISKLFGE